MAKGVGRGVGGGGARPGAGRPRGSRNKRSRELIAQIQQQPETDPRKYLQSVVADPDAPPAFRIQSALGLMPYCFPRLSLMKIAPHVPLMSDEAVVQLLGEIERRVVKPSSAARSRNLEEH